MAFVNSEGKNISFECSELIAELRQDIVEFGGSEILEVVTDQCEGVTIYKDYNFISSDASTAFKLAPGEVLQRMTATALLMLYEQQNSIL